MKKYTHKEWSKTAKTLSSGEETKDYFASLPLAGKTIKNIRILGFDYFHDETYMNGNENPDEFFYPTYLKGKRISRLDEPFIIEFTDGQQIEIEADSTINEIKIAFNEIPDNAEPSVNHNNIDGNTIFVQCLGKRIKAVKFLPEPPEAYIPIVIFVLNDGTQINIESWMDYFDVWLSKEGDTDEILPITWSELKKALRLQS